VRGERSVGSTDAAKYHRLIVTEVHRSRPTGRWKVVVAMASRNRVIVWIRDRGFRQLGAYKPDGSRRLERRGGFWHFLRSATLTVLILGALCVADARGDEPAAVNLRYVIDSWTEQDGLPSNQVEAIAQTPDGYLWVGTQAGLVRFDGVRFVYVEVLPGSTFRPQGITVLHTARDGTLWVGLGGNGGVTRIDHRGRITSYGVADGLARGRLQAIVETIDGAVWAGGLGGLFRLSGDRWGPVDVHEGFSGQTVISLYEDRRGNLWVGADAGVFVRKSGTQRFEHLKSPLLTRANGISEDPDGSIWISTPAGVFREGGLDERPDPVWHGGADNYFRVRHDRRGNLWVATLGGGLLQLPASIAGTGTAATRFTVQTGLVGNLVWSVFDDREGNIWVGTQTGLARLTPSQVLSIAISGPSRVVRAVESTSDGTMWAATPAGLIRFVNNSGEWQEQCVAPCSLDVTALHTDRDNTLWVATLSGLYRYRRDRLLRVPVRGAVLPPWIVAMTSDHRGGLWIRDRNGRLLLWRAGQLSTVDSPGVVDGRSVSALYTDHTGDVWVGFVDGGVVTFRDGNVEGLVALDTPEIDSVSTFFEDKSGVIWIGGGASLSRFDDGRLTTLPLGRTGLPGDGIVAILDDEDGNLWLGVRAGIVSLVPGEFDSVVAGHASRGYRLLDTSNGLQGSPGSIGRPSAVRSHDGTVAFITGHGVSIVSPRLLSDSSRPPPTVRIEGVVADQRSFSHAGDLQFPPRTNRIQIDYTAMTLIASERVRFRYWLEGFDENWVEAGRSRQAVYTDLSPGHYRFHVTAGNKEGLWSESGTTWGFMVKPSFYQTTWFIGGWVALAGIGLWGVWLLRVRHLRHRFGLVLAERARVAREIHDTLLQTLVGLTLKIDAVESQINSAINADAVKRQLAGVRRQLQRSVRETRESIRDLRCPEHHWRPLPWSLQEAGRVICEGCVHFELSIDGQPVRYPRVVEEQLLRIVQEALSNAVHHAEARVVRILLAYSSAGIRLRIADNGRGFDPDETVESQYDHWGMITMRERAAQIDGQLDIRSHRGEGTVVEVSVPASQAQLTRTPAHAEA
jgi:ligand-binding sensor domain-containing protein